MPLRGNDDSSLKSVPLRASDAGLMKPLREAGVNVCMPFDGVNV